MVRDFAPEPIDPDRIDALLDRARRAPSAGNTAATRFVVLDRPPLVAAYWDTTLPAGPGRDRFRWQGLLRAPVLILVVTEPGRYLERYREADKEPTGRGRSSERWPVPYWWVDAGAVIQNLLLLVVQDGLGACLFGAFDHEPALRERFALPPDVRLVATIAVGEPMIDEPGRSARRQRPTLDELVIRPELPGG
jgi:nitroreductase